LFLLYINALSEMSMMHSKLNKGLSFLGLSLVLWTACNSAEADRYLALLEEKEQDLKEREDALEAREKEVQENQDTYPYSEGGKNIDASNVYEGEFDNDEITMELTWNIDKSVYGRCFFDYSPNRIFQVSGTNYKDGRLQITMVDDQGVSFYGELSKSSRNCAITWKGYVYSGQEGSGMYSYGRRYLKFTRHKK